MKSETQKQIILKKLQDEGAVDNFWAIHNYILRLSDIILHLRREGYEIDGYFGEGQNKKNFIYTLVGEPKQLELLK